MSLTDETLKSGTSDDLAKAIDDIIKSTNDLLKSSTSDDPLKSSLVDEIIKSSGISSEELFKSVMTALDKNYGNADTSQQTTADVSSSVSLTDERPLAIIMVGGDSHLDSNNYGYHLNYPKETLYYERTINKIIEMEQVTHFIHAGDFVMHKDFSLSYRSEVDSILNKRKRLIESRGGNMIYLRGNHDRSGRSLTEYDYYAERGLFETAANHPILDIYDAGNSQPICHIELKDWGDISAFKPYGDKNILITHFYGVFDRLLEGDEMPNYGQALKLGNKTDWAGIDYILAGHIHTEHVMKGQIDGRNCIVHYLPCLARPAYIKRYEDGPNAVREGCVDLIRVYQHKVEIDRYPIEFLDNKVCFNMERIMNDAAKLDLSRVDKDRHAALKSMAEELQQYERRETDPVQQVMNLGNADQRHKDIVKEWFDKAKDLLKTQVKT